MKFIKVFIQDMHLLSRLKRDRKSAIFANAPLVLIVMINSKIGEIRNKYNILYAIRGMNGRPSASG